MGKNVGLEELREALSDQKLWLALGLVKKIAMLGDRSALRLQVSILPEEREIVATMTWDVAGPESGIYDLPALNDLVLVAFADADKESAFVIRRLSSKTDLIPLKALGGDLVVQAKAAKNAYVVGKKVYIAKKNNVPTEPLVLGNVMLSCLTDLCTQITALCDAVITGPVAISSAPGAPAPVHPTLGAAALGVKVAIAALKSTYVTTPGTNIASQLGFTERGPG